MKVASACVLACLLAVVAADTYVWNGGNLNFNNAANWVDGTVPMGEVTETDLRAVRTLGDEEVSSPFTSFVAGGEYNVGARIRLPKNGKLVFQADSPVSIKFSENATGSAAVFKGPRQDDEFLFNCKKNWKLQRGSELIAATKPPCFEDSVVFPAGGSYAPYSLERLTNVHAVTVADKVIESCEDLPMYQFGGIDCAKFFIDDQSMCSGELTTYSDAGQPTGDCLCFNSCPSKDEELAEQEAIRKAAEIAAEREAALLAETLTRNVVLDVDLAIFGVDMDLVAASLGEFEFTSAVQEKLASLPAGAISATNIDLQFDDASNTVSISTVVTTKAADFLNVGESVMDLDVETTDKDAADTLEYATDKLSDPTRANVATFLARNFVDITRELLVRAAEEALETSVTVACPPATNETEPSAASMALVGLMRAVAESSETLDPTELLMAACPNFTMELCPEPEAMDDLLVNATAPYNGTEAASIAKAFVALQNFTGDDCLIDFIVDGTLTDVVQDYVDTQLKEKVMTQVFTAISDWIIAGNDLPPIDVYHAINSDNRPALQSALQTALQTRTFVRSLSNLAVSTPASTARRAVAAANPKVFSFQLTYTFESDPASADDFSILIGTAVYNTVSDVIADVLASFDAAVPTCFDLVTDAFDAQCIQDEADAFVATLPESLTEEEVALRVQEFVADLVECGSFGRDMDGNCYAGAPPAGIETDTIVSNSASKYEAGGLGSTLYIIVGAAAGGVLLIIIVIIIVVKSRGGSSGSAGKAPKDSSRTVVAFENPMYDNPEDGITAGDQPLYEDAGADEGLYDEPAFNAEAKTNPLYQSTEDLMGAGMEDGEDEGGYLDVAPDAGDE